MLKTSSGHNVKKEYVSENLWKAIIQATRNGIDMKISALKNLISLPNNEAILAGLYTYVVEEFGKIILLSKCPSVKNRREITYNRLKYPDTARPCKRHIGRIHHTSYPVSKKNT
jgi:hypothetical protein